MRERSLLASKIIGDHHQDGHTIGSINHGVAVEDCAVEVVFRDIDARIIQEIEKAEAVFGCVAWLTHAGILAALAKKHGVGIVVQKEDFLRPDSRDLGRAKTRELYAALPGFNRYHLTAASSYDYAADPRSDAVRCVGLANNDRRLAMPRMHNKFLVFCRWQRDEGSAYPSEGMWVPYAVWTGSFNLTYNASESLENGVFLRSEAVAKAYADEFGEIFGLSESLDWSTDWVAPQYRLGS